MNSIEKLVSLVSMKNDLNRRRRRFYYYMTFNKSYRASEKWVMTYGTPEQKAAFPIERHKRLHITKKAAKAGYKKAQADMKAMTAEIRSLRLELGARLVWTDHGGVSRIEFDGDGPVIYAKNFWKYVEMYQVDKILLGSG